MATTKRPRCRICHYALVKAIWHNDPTPRWIAAWAKSNDIKCACGKTHSGDDHAHEPQTELERYVNERSSDEATEV